MSALNGEAGTSVMSAIFDALMAVTPGGTAEPYLAKWMNPMPENAAWTMTLQRDHLRQTGHPDQ